VSADRPALPAAPGWKKNFYAIWVAELLAIAGFGTMNPILPFYVQHLGITADAEVKMWVGLVQTAGSAMVAIFSPIWGRLADSYGRRVMLLRALVGATAMMLLMGFAAHPWQLVLFRAIGGVFTGTVAAATVLVASTAPAEAAGRSLGLLQTAVLVGSSFGPVLGGALGDLLGYRAAFFCTAALTAVSAAIVAAFVREDFVPKPIDGPLWRRVVPDFSVITRSRELSLLVLTVAIVNLAGGSIMPILPLFIQSLAPDTQLIGTTAGAVIGVRAVAAAIAAALAGRLSDRIGYRRVLLFCLVGGALAHLALLLVRTPLQLGVLRFFTGALMGGTIPTVNALIAARADRARHGTVFGVASSVSSTGNALGPAFGAAIGALWGFPPVFVAVTAILGAGAIFVKAAMPAPQRGGGRQGA
jgi:MFS transporter, DHA1 family, multidrug resistance protein